MVYQFTRVAVSVPDASEVPEIVESARAIVSQIPSWSKCKKTTTTTTSKDRTKGDEICTTVYRTTLNDEVWFARHTLVPDTTLPYSAFREGLLLNHSKNEAEYIHTLHSATLLHSDSDSSESRHGGASGIEVWHLLYKFTFPTGNRDFVVSVIARDVSETEFLVVSVNTKTPDCPIQKDFIRATYTSIERVRRREDGTSEWSMCTTTSPEGLVPSFIVNQVMPGQIVADVPAFLKWAQQRLPATKQ